jgi:hypothetical protein
MPEVLFPSLKPCCVGADHCVTGARYTSRESLWGYDESVRGLPRAFAARTDGEGLGLARGLEVMYEG